MILPFSGSSNQTPRFLASGAVEGLESKVNSKGLNCQRFKMGDVHTGVAGVAIIAWLAFKTGN